MAFHLGEELRRRYGALLDANYNASQVSHLQDGSGIISHPVVTLVGRRRRARHSDPSDDE